MKKYHTEDEEFEFLEAERDLFELRRKALKEEDEKNDTDPTEPYNFEKFQNE